MSQVFPVNIELAVIIHVYQLVCKGVLHVLLVSEMALTKDNRPSWVEASGTREIAWRTHNVRGRHRAPGQLKML
jgi:hypothetical protein